MINTNRIVPISVIDLLSMYGLILLQDSNNSSLAALQANTVDGQFSCGTGVKLAAQPVKSCNFTASSGTLFFVADFNYEGFTVGGSAATIADNDVEVNADGKTLYKAVLSSGTVTITQVGF